MEIVDNTVVDGGQVLCTFNIEEKKREYQGELTKGQKMSIGRLLKPYEDGRKTLEEKPIVETPPEDKNTIVLEQEEFNKTGKLPWEVYPNCPQPGPAGDKTEAVVKYIHKYHSEFYLEYYNHRKTCIDVDRKQTRELWESRGKEFYERGLKITDCPPNASQEDRDFFEAGYKKYMISELEAQTES